MEAQPTETIDRSTLAERTAALDRDGYRLVQVCCSIVGEEFEVMYSFDKDYRFLNLRVLAQRDDPTLPSITGTFFGAFTYENEMKELFGLNFTDLKLDYKGNFLRAKTKFEFAPQTPKPAAPTPAN